MSVTISVGEGHITSSAHRAVSLQMVADLTLTPEPQTAVANYVPAGGSPVFSTGQFSSNRVGALLILVVASDGSWVTSVADTAGLTWTHLVYGFNSVPGIDVWTSTVPAGGLVNDNIAVTMNSNVQVSYDVLIARQCAGFVPGSITVVDSSGQLALSTGLFTPGAAANPNNRFFFACALTHGQDQEVSAGCWQKHSQPYQAYSSLGYTDYVSLESGCTLGGPPGDIAFNSAGSAVAFAYFYGELAAAPAGGETVSWSATGLPPGLSINSATGLISGSPSSAGTYTVIATASDNAIDPWTGNRAFTWTVT